MLDGQTGVVLELARAGWRKPACIGPSPGDVRGSSAITHGRAMSSLEVGDV